MDEKQKSRAEVAYLLLAAAVEDALGEGVGLTDAVFGVRRAPDGGHFELNDEGRCCPLGALLLAVGDTAPPTLPGVLAPAVHVLGCSGQEAMSLFNGFDSSFNYGDSDEFYEVGRRLRRVYYDTDGVVE